MAYTPPRIISVNIGMPGQPTIGGVPHDREKLQQVVRLLGPEKVAEIAGAFVVRLESSFLSSPGAARREAHDLINIAGLLGLEDFAALCRDLQVEPPLAAKSGEQLMSEARAVKMYALAVCREKILPDLQAMIASSPAAKPC